MDIPTEFPMPQSTQDVSRRFNFTRREKLFLGIIVILVMSNVFLGLRYAELNRRYNELKVRADAYALNDKVLDFSDLFINKVLKSENEVSFEDRLQLENSVRDLNDPELFGWWTSFVQSQTEEQAQTAVKNLLSALVKKIKIE